MQAFQDFYPENVAHCYGCGRLNQDGHQIKTFWEGDETVTHFQPRPEHTAIPGFVYGVPWTASRPSASSPARCRSVT